MTEQPAAAPTQQAAPPPPAAPAPAQEQAVPVTDAAGLTPDEETELGTLLAKRDAAATAAGAAMLQVEPPYAALTYGGLTVNTDPTAVPAEMVAAITEAAASAGVTITQQES